MTALVLQLLLVSCLCIQGLHACEEGVTEPWNKEGIQERQDKERMAQEKRIELWHAKEKGHFEIEKG